MHINTEWLLFRILHLAWSIDFSIDFIRRYWDINDLFINIGINKTNFYWSIILHLKS